MIKKSKNRKWRKADYDTLIKDAVAIELNKRGWTRYRLWKDNQDVFKSKGHVYMWFSGQSALSDDRASILLDRLGLEIRKKRR